MPLGDKDKENLIMVLFFSLSPMANFPANVMANQTSLNKLYLRVFVAAENGSVEVLELVGIFHLKTETFGAKNW